MQYILDAENHVKQLQELQLRWADSSLEATAALERARTAAVLRVLSRQGAAADVQHDIRVWVQERWTVDRERAAEFYVEADESGWVDTVTCGDGEHKSAIETALILLEELWLDVVLETDTWAQRVLASRRGDNDARV